MNHPKEIANIHIYHFTAIMGLLGIAGFYIGRLSDVAIPGFLLIVALLYIAFIWLSGRLEVLMLILIMGLFGFSKDFAYLGLTIAGFNIYITEIVLLLSIAGFLGYHAIKKQTVNIVALRTMAPFIVFILVGTIAAIYGAYCGNSNILRSSVLVYYSLFYLLILLIVTDISTFKRILVAFCVGSMVGLIVVLNNFITGSHESVTSTGAIRYAHGSYTFYLGATAVALVCFLPSLKKNKIIFGAIIALLVAGMAIVQHRSGWISLFAALMFSFIYIDGQYRKTHRRNIAFALVLISIFLSLGLVLADNQVLVSISDRVMSISEYSADPNSSARLSTWKALVQSVLLKKPVLGFGMGSLGIENATESTALIPLINPHNAVVSIYYQTGLLGVTAFFWFIFSFYKRNIDRLRDMSKMNQEPLVMVALLSAHMFLFVFSIFNVVLEGPYMGIFFWIIMGLVEVFGYLICVDGVKFQEV